MSTLNDESNKEYVVSMFPKDFFQRTARDQNEDTVKTHGKQNPEKNSIKNKRAALKSFTNNSGMMALTSIINLEKIAKQEIMLKKSERILKDMVQTHDKQKTAKSSIKTEKIENKVKMTMPKTLYLEKRTREQITVKKSDNRTGQHEQILKNVANVNSDFSNLSKVTTKSNKNNLLMNEINKIMVPAHLNVKKNDFAEPFAVIKPTMPMSIDLQSKPTPPRISNISNKTEQTVHMSTAEYMPRAECVHFSQSCDATKTSSELQINDKSEVVCDNITIDFDKLNWDDPYAVSHYAKDIFDYLKEREKKFPITDYMVKQINLSKSLRSRLIDWMVKVQEGFDLNDETLYLAIKIVDLYLCRVIINKDQIILLGAIALFIACKYDEQRVPLVEDFLYVCNGIYKRNELIKMEMNVLKTIDYDIGIPLSYNFLRRYARCAEINSVTLTLACYILESALMDYVTISFSDSQLAAATLYMALRMFGEKKGWTEKLEYYSGYKLEEFAMVVVVLNAGLHRVKNYKIKTIRKKYSREIFHEVAKVPLMTTVRLFEDNLDFSFDNLNNF
ncbi:G2/mitotic-specific cyclin-B3-like [Teleopsis dalmanni]|uniref:G2/mitotic-specific cyclin-B3-like n=1 Tax=Teleopsis dalmanni TaxID=139649 RepID=UPI0018CE5D72|nr:G2/mitotic-specific cyclin-B3-like [Teleopsis dalmanni]